MMPIFVALIYFLNLQLGSCSQIRIDCHPDNHATKQRCQARGCTWAPTRQGIPWCIFPCSNPNTMAGYNTTTTLTNGQLHRRNTPTLYGNDAQTVYYRLTEIDADSFSLTFGTSPNPLEKKEQPTECSFLDRECRKRQKITQDTKAESTNNYKVTIQQSPFGYSVERSAASSHDCAKNIPLFDSRNLPGFTFSRHFIQISTRVPTRNVYGLGEQWHRTFRRNFNWVRHSMFNQDQYPIENTNLYGVQPFYVGLDNNNKSYGVFLHTNYPLDVFLQPDPELVTFRLMGGHEFSIYHFLGPSMDDVIAQYTHVMGRPHMPPYWALGFHLCRFGYRNLGDLKKVWDRNRAARIPQDTQWVDIGYMDRKHDFTVGAKFKGFNKYLKDVIHASNRKLVPILDPGIPSHVNGTYAALTYGKKLGIFIKDARTQQPLEGKVWPGDTYWPDFTNPRTLIYWLQMLRDFEKVLDYDGLWIDMNEPASFVHGSNTGCAVNALNNPPFSPVAYEPLYHRTVCLDAVTYAGRHIQSHTRYGHLEARDTYKALQYNRPNKRPFVLTRSTAPGTGAFAAHWMGDTVSDWPNLGQSLIQLLEFNIFGIPFSGSDICGFNHNTTEQLCLRWQQLGAFYPFARNHNSDDCIDQDPAVWSSNTVTQIRDALSLRYTLLPYLYTLMFKAHTQGVPVVRAMMYDYPSDVSTWNKHDQIMWGGALMIAPILAQNTHERWVYFPKGMWYDITGKQAATPERNRELKVHMDSINSTVYIKGGYILFRHEFGVESTYEARHRPFVLTIAPNHNMVASGTMYWDDGESPSAVVHERYCIIHASSTQTAKSGRIEVEAKQRGCHQDDMQHLDTIQVFGVAQRPNMVTVNGRKLDSNHIQYDARKRVLQLLQVHVDLYAKMKSKIVWQ